MKWYSSRHLDNNEQSGWADDDENIFAQYCVWCGARTVKGPDVLAGRKRRAPDEM
jgi:hypothetical protein